MGLFELPCSGQISTQQQGKQKESSDLFKENGFPGYSTSSAQTLAGFKQFSENARSRSGPLTCGRAIVILVVRFRYLATPSF
ncbi:hypothetical protein RSSM_04828 [Rhodopirellula sallentina SM41]|uniref:Uncharacterized protein n=1 Tax=Rhodopirellula sallentina SM41 TaxID=1263870 RepID=M5TWV0_9BACT|nr:hypothetical protein RSSM_04828 [Rhodopirellula sallentina SM41]